MSHRGHHRVVVLPSAERTVLQTVDIDTLGYTGMRVYVDVTAITDTPILTLTMSGYDSFADEIYTLLAGAAIAAISFTQYSVYVGATVTANVSANQALPDRVRFGVAVTDADAATYSITAVLF